MEGSSSHASSGRGGSSSSFHSGGDGASEISQQQNMDPLESSIVQGFQNLQFLKAYSNVQMDDLVRDLTCALEDSVMQKTTHHKKDSNHSARHTIQRKVKRKSKKRKSAAVSQSGHRSDATESSVDETVLLESITQQSDSDDWILNAKCLPTLSTLSAIAKQSPAIPQVESDSFTENFSPLQPLRPRRRKFKRMAIDLTEPEDGGGSSDSKNMKGKVKSHLSRTDNIMDDDTRSRSPVSLPSTSEVIIPGKRKRLLKSAGGNSFDEPMKDDVSTKNSKARRMECETKESTSSLSSSECSEARFTGDEGQEGDDEQSDFFHEPGPACGIPGIIPWWENARVTDAERDSNFEKILTGSFEHMSVAAQRSFKTRLKQLAGPGREYRAARRYFKDRRPGYTLSRFLADRQKWQQASESMSKKPVPCASGWVSNGTNSASGADTKRQRKTPPTTPISHGGEFVGQHADPIPDNNIGSRILQNMGWSPGSGLGPDGSGITAPIMAYRKQGRKGIGATAVAKS